MAKPRRILRLQQLILEAAAETIQRELDDPRIGLVSITHVKLAPDLTAARVYWSCLGTDAQRRTCERGLANALPVIQRAVATALRTRVTPHLSLAYDATLERAQRLEEIFEHLRHERDDVTAPAEDAAGPESAESAETADAAEAPEAAEAAEATDSPED
jgi:ribosome-binding factor A